MFVQMDELPSMYSRPLLSRSNAPRPSTKTSGSCSAAHHSRISVKGCQTNRLSHWTSLSVFHSAIAAWYLLEAITPRFQFVNHSRSSKSHVDFNHQSPKKVA